MSFIDIDEPFHIRPLRYNSYNFPDPRSAPADGLLAYGGDLSVGRLLQAYASGIFPWYNENDPTILWWSPDPRLILYPNRLIVRKSFRKVLRNRGFEVVFDSAFKEVIKACATTPRKGQSGTWITPQMQEAYIALHHEGYAHSIEVYLKDRLVGGLYGVALGGAFFGESMFSHVSDASKVALKALSDVLGARGYDFIDCQMKTDHLVGLGAEAIERSCYLDMLARSIKKPTERGLWQEFKWEYCDG